MENENRITLDEAAGLSYLLPDMITFSRICTSQIKLKLFLTFSVKSSY